MCNGSGDHSIMRKDIRNLKEENRNLKARIEALEDIVREHINKEG